MPLPPAVVELLERQHSMAARHQLVPLARTDDEVDGWVRHGLLDKVMRSVYRRTGAQRVPEETVMGPVLRCGEGAVAGPRMSAALHDLEGFDFEQRGDVIVPLGRRIRATTFAVIAMSVLPKDLLVARGVPALSPAFGLLCLAPVLAEKPWRVAYDSARRRRVLTEHLLRQRIEVYPDHPGSPVVQGYLDSGILVPDGEGERVLMKVLRGFDPEPEWGVRDLVPGRRLDCAWRPIRFGLEYDGRDNHMFSTDRDNDGIRDLQCAVAGVQVLRITGGMIKASPDRVRELIEDAYRRRKVDISAAPAPNRH